MSERFEIAPVSIDYNSGTGAGSGTLDLTQMSGFSVVPNATHTGVRVGGSLDRLGQVMSKARPNVDLRTKDLATALAQITPTVGLLVEDTATFRLLERSEGGGFKTGTENVTITGHKGLIVPTELTVEQEADEGADLSLRYFPVAEGATAPLTFADGVDLDASPAAAFTAMYFLGGVYQNGTEICGVQRASIDFGLDAKGIVKCVGAYPQGVLIQDRNPSIRIQMTKVDWLASKSLFIESVNTTFRVYFQKATTGTDRVAVATAGHVYVGCTAGSIEFPNVGGDAPDDATVELVVHPTGTLVVNTASAIP